MDMFWGELQEIDKKLWLKGQTVSPYYTGAQSTGNLAVLSQVVGADRRYQFLVFWNGNQKEA